ncbi:MAG TPA: hypothetical protein VL860_04355 [Planctomycetota bacterium]|nr:hypothetical protein [Planctomycetota bacterium]
MARLENIHLHGANRWVIVLALLLLTAAPSLRAADENQVYPDTADGLATMTANLYAKEEYREAYKVYRMLSNLDQKRADLVAHDEIDLLWRKAIDYFKNNRPEQHQQAMVHLWELKPNADEIERMINVAGPRVLSDMLGNSATKTVQLEAMIGILNGVRAERLGKNSEFMKKLVARLVSSDVKINEQADIYREIEIIGPYIVPQLSEYYADKDEAIRAKVVNATVLIGSRAVLPAIKLLDSKDDMIKVNAISVLTQVHPKDVRSVPAIKRVLEDKKVSANVRQQAALALTILTSVPTANLRAADEYFYQEANRYYLRDAGVGDESIRAQGLVWHLTAEGKLDYTQVPFYVWSDIMAEQAGLEGFALVAKDLPVRAAKFPPILACIYAAAYQDTLRMQDIVAIEPNSRPLTDIERQEIVDRSERFRFYENMIRAVGAKYVYRGLAKSLNDKRPEVSVMLADLVAELDPKGFYLPAFTKKDSQVNGRQTTSKFFSKYADTIDPAGGRWMLIYQETYETQTGELVGEPSGLYVEQRRSYDQAMTDISQTPKTNEVQAPSGMEKVVSVEEEGRPPEAMGAGEREANVRRQPWSPLTAEGTALVNALSHEDQRIRFAAAISLAKMNRYPEDFAGSDQVVQRLSQAVVIGGAAQLLLVVEDVGKRNRVRSALEHLGFSVSESDNGRDAFDQAMGYPPKAGVIIDANLTSNYTTKKLWEQLESNLRTRYIPRALLVEPGTIPSYEQSYGSRNTTVYIETKFDDFGAMQGTVKEASEKKIVAADAGFDTKLGLAGKTLLFTTGNARGLSLQIVSNEADSLFLKDPIAKDKLPQAGDRFTIGGGMLAVLRDPVMKLINAADKPSVRANYSHSMAVAAAQALSKIDPAHTNLKWQDATKAIVEVLTTPVDDELRLPCIEAARNLSVHEAAQALFNLCDPATQTPLVVGAALDALKVVNPNLHQKAKALMTVADPYISANSSRLDGESTGRVDHFQDMLDTLRGLRVDGKLYEVPASTEAAP